MMTFACTTVTGGGREIPLGLWVVTKTSKRVVFELLSPPHPAHGVYLNGVGKLVCPTDNQGPHCLRCWPDGTYTVYPHRSGTPFAFTVPPLPEPVHGRSGDGR